MDCRLSHRSESERASERERERGGGSYADLVGKTEGGENHGVLQVCVNVCECARVCRVCACERDVYKMYKKTRMMDAHLFRLKLLHHNTLDTVCTASTTAHATRVRWHWALVRGRRSKGIGESTYFRDGNAHHILDAHLFKFNLSPQRTRLRVHRFNDSTRNTCGVALGIGARKTVALRMFHVGYLQTKGDWPIHVF